MLHKCQKVKGELLELFETLSTTVGKAVLLLPYVLLINDL